MNKHKVLLGGIAVLLAGPAVAADIVIGVPNWPSVKATANILKVVIEDNLGYEVELQNGSNPIIFEAMDSNSMHVHPEVWLPNQQNLTDKFVEEKGTVRISKNSVNAFQGMCVNKAAAQKHDITSINDLTRQDVADLIDGDGDGKGELWIGAPGWASTNVEQIRAKSYGYEQTMELTQSDETLAYADLNSAVKAGDTWIGFCYGPHYIFALHDLVRLDEPEHDPAKWSVSQPTDDPDWLENSEAAVAWPSIEIRMAYAASLEEEFPTVARMLSNIPFTTDQLSDMTYALAVEDQDAEKYARTWTAENENIVLDWLSQ
uniref:ABC transporter substrate-binding protein n=1 Tax=Roseovarius indicus TaxID=540747 RepID=UPI003B52D808